MAYLAEADELELHTEYDRKFVTQGHSPPGGDLGPLTGCNFLLRRDLPTPLGYVTDRNIPY